jgi:tetratricopeptide (TPR) repeat protein
LWFSLALLAIAGSARAETAAEAYARGNTLLRQGEFQQAIGALAQAARTERGNQEYLSRYMMVRQIMQLQEGLETETNPARWEYSARALEHFYRTERMHDEALALSRRKFERLQDARSAATLAETQLAMSKPADALATLESLGDEKATPATKSLQAIALAHLDRMEEARQVAQTVELPEQTGPGVLYSAARMYAATGSSDRAVETLRRCFEQVPAGQLDAFKDHARNCADFANLAPTAQFASVLKTASKIPESKCSGGTTCAGCPMRGKCPSSQ